MSPPFKSLLCRAKVRTLSTAGGLHRSALAASGSPLPSLLTPLHKHGSLLHSPASHPRAQHSAASGPFHLLLVPCNSFHFCVHRLPSPFPLDLSSNIDSAASRTSLNGQLTSVSAPLPGSFFSWPSSASETLHTEPSGFFVYHLSPTPGGEPRGGRDLCLFDRVATVLGSCTYQGPGLWWEFQEHCLQGGRCLLEHSHTSCPLTRLLGQSPLLSSPWPGELGPQHWPSVVDGGAGHQGHWAWTAWLGLVPDFITIRPQRPPALA